MTPDKVEFNRMEYGDRVKTESGFMIEVGPYSNFYEEEDGTIMVEYSKPKPYGKIQLHEKVIALYRRTCKLKRKK